MDTNNASAKSPSNEPLDLLRRFIEPIEKRMTNGNWTFQTQDKERYIRTPDGVIRRKTPKVNGKQAKKARRACRP